MSGFRSVGLVLSGFKNILPGYVWNFSFFFSFRALTLMLYHWLIGILLTVFLTVFQFRRVTLPYHVLTGGLVFGLALASCLTGLQEYACFNYG